MHIAHANVPARVAPLNGAEIESLTHRTRQANDHLTPRLLGCKDFRGGKPGSPYTFLLCPLTDNGLRSLQEFTTDDDTGSCSRRAGCPPGCTPLEPRQAWRCVLRSAFPAGTARRNPSSPARGQTPSCTRCTDPNRATPRSRTNSRSSFPR